MSEPTDTFAQWRIYIIKTLDKLVGDVEDLKSVTHEHGEYNRRLKFVESDLQHLRDALADADKAIAVSSRQVAIYAGIGGFLASGIVTGVIAFVFDS